MQAPALTHHIAQKQRLLIMALGVIVGVVLIIVMAIVFFSKKNLEPLVTKIAAQQQELLRVNELADRFRPPLALRQTQATVASIVASDLQDMLAARSAFAPEKIPKETSSLYADADAEERFEDAARRNALDREYRDTLKGHLEMIQVSISELSGESITAQLRSQLTTISAHTKFLLEQL